MSGLSTDQVNFFNENGYLVLDKLIPDNIIDDLYTEYEDRVTDTAEMLLEKKEITDTKAEMPFAERYAELLQQYPEFHRFLNVSLPLINDNQDPDYFAMHTGPALFNLLRHENILDAMESIIGPEISVNPVQQNRMKPPLKNLDLMHSEHSNVGTTTWHQDIAVLFPEGEESDIITVWVALTDATKENGCLVTIPGSHKKGNAVHCPGKLITSETNVPQKVIRDMKGLPLPVKRGGAILFHRRNIHSALPNRSDHMRWSMDLRYSITGQHSGRPAFPSIVARSATAPETEVHDWKIWQDKWMQARESVLSGSYSGLIYDAHKWDEYASGPICA